MMHDAQFFLASFVGLTRPPGGLGDCSTSTMPVFFSPYPPKLRTALPRLHGAIIIARRCRSALTRCC